MRRSKTLLDYTITFFTEFLVLAAGVLVYRLAATMLGESGFSEYAVVRRSISFIQPVVMLGVGVGLPRYVAYAMEGKAGASPGDYLKASFRITLLTTILFVVIALLFKDFLAQLFFGNEAYSGLILPLCVCISGLVLHSLVYSFFRGRIKMIAANLIQAFNLGIVPLAAFYFAQSVTDVLLFTGIAWFITGGMVFIAQLLISGGGAYGSGKGAGKELFSYGIRRVPGDMLLMALLSFPAFLAANSYDDSLEIAGQVAFAMSLLNMAGAAFAPVCLILLPQTSRILASSDFPQLKRIFRQLTFLTLALCGCGILVTVPFMDILLRWYLGEAAPELVSICRLVLFASIGYCLYISLRSILDAFYFKAVNSANILIAFLFFLAGAVWSWYSDAGLRTLLFVFVFSLSLLGLLTWWRVWSLIREKSGLTSSETGT
ncbi:MAG: hypothetical protein IT233_11015 [Bacteroidia bacterium]|nr:hypothetical protein [Bacteroidia bacterium]